MSVAQALRETCSVAAARDPLPAARALDHKLRGPPTQRRYTAPTYIIDEIAIPGFNPVEAYETVIANRAPNILRRQKPSSVRELLEWAGEPLATVEIAHVMQLDSDEARAALRSLAQFTPAGADGYWALESAERQRSTSPLAGSSADAASTGNAGFVGWATPPEREPGSSEAADR